jgi:hypothetical protein
MLRIPWPLAVDAPILRVREIERLCAAMERAHATRIRAALCLRCPPSTVASGRPRRAAPSHSVGPRQHLRLRELIARHSCNDSQDEWLDTSCGGRASGISLQIPPDRSDCADGYGPIGHITRDERNRGNRPLGVT